ncbi:hypothetical protein GCM10010174_51210 [Kutzneria viridogrisea]|uniref:Chitinase n=1 Tax=Kutzneria viridogrisea TaxID=47990 RepID=A0ABR6BPK6_9PSEU|nr:putative chitinase [Kutzneria viridogrisea]
MTALRSVVVLTALTGVVTGGAALPTAAAAPLAAAGHRIGVLRDGAVKVKEGGLDAGWTVQERGATKFQIDGDRIGALLSDGRLEVKAGGLDAPWVVVEDHVADFSLSGTRIGALRADGTAEVKDGGLDATWTPEDDHVRQLAVAGARIAVLRENGDLKVKDGALDSQWVLQEDHVVQIALSEDRIGAVRDTGRAEVKEGGLDTPWAQEEDNVTQLALWGRRIGAVRTDGTAEVKEGGLDAPWVVEDVGTKQIVLAGDRIGTLHGDGTAYVKEGGLDARWQLEDDTVTTLRLASATPSGGGSQVSMADIAAIYGNAYATDIVRAGLPSLNTEMAAGGITTPARKAAFLATLKHESGFVYSAGEAGQTAQYRGRGFIQITGSSNYGSAGRYFGHDFLNSPGDAASLQWSAPLARWYWTVARNINPMADRLDMGAVDGAIGYSTSLDPGEAQRRCDDFKKALAYYNGSLPGGIRCDRH